MKKVKFLLAACILTTVFIGCSEKEQMVGQEESVALKSASIKTKYIIQLKEDASISSAALNDRSFKVKEKAIGLLKKYQIADDIEDVYGVAIQGFTVKMAPGQAKKLQSDGAIKVIEEDQIVTLSPIQVNGKPGGGTQGQSTPWGITRVGGTTSYSGNNVVWIIDTGVDLTHPDLNVNVNRGKSFVPRVTSPNDDNGHGSHVAGIIAAKNNSVGVVGVAAGATVIPVKVLDRRGSGAYSGVIAGVDYVAENGNPGDVANMSLGGPVSESLDDAVLNAAAKGIKFALAAGNESADASNSSPARVNGDNIYTISAMDSKNIFAYFSNWGTPVDFCAPGVSIYSAYKGGGYASLSGTSMASPHVAGILLLGSVKTDGYVIDDVDGKPDPIAHK